MKSKITRSSLFLTELVLDLFVFVVCAAVCVGLLIRADAIMIESKRITEAVYIAQTLADINIGSGEYRFNSNGTMTDSEGVYTAICTPVGDTYIIEVFDDSDVPVYTLQAAASEVRG